jgi:hypothetical protein
MSKISRKAAIVAIALPALAAALPVAGTADDKLPKSQVNYQDRPNGSDKCALCKYFVPGKDDTSSGSCQLVAGSISPSGWCQAFTVKSS